MDTVEYVFCSPVETAPLTSVSHLTHILQWLLYPVPRFMPCQSALYVVAAVFVLSTWLLVSLFPAGSRNAAVFDV